MDNLSTAAKLLEPDLYGKPDGPSRLFDSWVAGKVQDTDLRGLVPLTWLYNDSPEHVIGARNWMRLFRAGGFMIHPTSLTRPVGSLTVFRGATEERSRGMAWTETPEMAGHFRQRHVTFGKAHIYRATLDAMAILALFERRGEGREFVLDPEQAEITLVK
jgi:hypothetical protein